MSLAFQLQQTLLLSDQETHIIEDLFTPTLFAKGDLLIEPLHKQCSLYFISEGYIRIYALQEGREITQWIGSPLSFITDLSSWLFNSPIKWYIEALTPVKALYITKTNYNQLATLVDLWHEKERFFIGHCFEQMENRIFQFISLTADQRYVQFFNQLGYLFNQVPHQYIASMLGMTPETLSRLRKKNRTNP